MALTNKLNAIGDAIRSKTGKTAKLTLDEMPTEIKNISGIDDTVHTYSAVKTSVANYLTDANSKYTESNTSTTSVVSTYFSDMWAYDDQPNGYNVTISESGTIYIMDEDDGSGYSESVKSGTYTIKNLNPAHTYFYVVKNSSGKVKSNGRVKATGQLRTINASGKTRNFRDIGGMTCDGGTIKYGMYFRGSQIDTDFEGDDTTYNVLRNQCHIKTEIDMRETPPQNYSLLGFDVNYCNLSLPDNFGNYHWIVNSSFPQYEKMAVDILKEVMDSAIKGMPIYLHCTFGADRTGAISVLVEGLLGVSRIDIDKDYELTNFAYGNKARTYSLYVGLINKINEYSGNTFRDKLVSWLKSVGGINADTLNAFRSAIIDGSPSVISWNNSVTNKLTGLTSNGTTTAKNSGSYTATLSFASGYSTIQSVVVTMGGVDITSSVYNSSNKTITIPFVSGDIVIVAIASSSARSITYNLTSVTSSSSVSSVTNGGTYLTTLSVADGLDMNVVVTMGGTNVTSSVYNSSTKVISISSVTGNVVITASATYPTTPTLTWNKGKNLSYSDGVTVTNSNNYAYNDFLPIDATATYTSTFTMASSDTNYRVLAYDANQKFLGVAFASQVNGSSWKVSTKYTNAKYVRFRLYSASATHITTVTNSFVLKKS